MFAFSIKNRKRYLFLSKEVVVAYVTAPTEKLHFGLKINEERVKELEIFYVQDNWKSVSMRGIAEFFGAYMFDQTDKNYQASREFFEQALRKFPDETNEQEIFPIETKLFAYDEFVFDTVNSLDPDNGDFILDYPPLLPDIDNYQRYGLLSEAFERCDLLFDSSDDDKMWIRRFIRG
jgi:hypothetical protein